MATGPRFLSRRALLKLAAATPASALALGSLAEKAIAQGSGGDKKMLNVSRHLSKKFVTGIRKWEQDKKNQFKIEVDPEVFEKGFELSGDVVLANLSCFHDDLEQDPTTRCAVACGYWAADLAHTGNGNHLTAAVFQRAWCDTKKTFGTKKCDAANPQPNPVKCGPADDVGDKLPGDIKPRFGILASGCA